MGCIHQLCQKSSYICIRAHYILPREFSHTLLLQAGSPQEYTLTAVLLRFTCRRHHSEDPIKNAHVSRSPGKTQTLARSQYACLRASYQVNESLTKYSQPSGKPDTS